MAQPANVPKVCEISGDEVPPVPSHDPMVWEVCMLSDDASLTEGEGVCAFVTT